MHCQPNRLHTHTTHTHTHTRFLPRLLAAAGRGTAALPLALSRCGSGRALAHRSARSRPAEGPSGRPALAARRPQPQPTCRRGLRRPVPAAGARPRGWRRRRGAGAGAGWGGGAVLRYPPPPHTARIAAQGGRAEPSPRHPGCRAGRNLTCGGCGAGPAPCPQGGSPRREGRATRLHFGEGARGQQMAPPAGRAGSAKWRPGVRLRGRVARWP